MRAPILSSKSSVRGKVRSGRLAWQWELRWHWAVARGGPQPVAVVQTQDRYADCAAIAAESEANNQKVTELASEQGLKVGQNIAAGVAGLVVWPLLFAMDFQDSAGKEVAALQSRQQYLTTLAEQRCSAAVPAHAVPARKH
jgi:hypothetical protein